MPVVVLVLHFNKITLYEMSNERAVGIAVTRDCNGSFFKGKKTLLMKAGAECQCLTCRAAQDYLVNVMLGDV